MPATIRIPLELKGADYFADTNTHDGTWFKIYVLTTANFAGLTIGNWNATPTGVSIAVGTELYGNITSIDLASGSVIAYRR